MSTQQSTPNPVLQRLDGFVGDWSQPENPAAPRAQPLDG
jgi:hypothetical protein